MMNIKASYHVTARDLTNIALKQSFYCWGNSGLYSLLANAKNMYREINQISVDVEFILIFIDIELQYSMLISWV